MIPIRDNLQTRVKPTITYTLIALNIVIFLWDRNWHLFGPSVVFPDLAMRPKAIVDAVRFGDFSSLATLFTMMFLHGNLTHIVFNLLFLLAFGPSVEVALGSWRFALYYVFWGLMACFAEILVTPNSGVPVLGASGAIGGVLGSYFLLFPGSRITLVVPPLLFLPFSASAWALLGLWFLWQIAFPQQGVANWAHAGGFLAGMVTVLIMGGRGKVLKGKDLIELKEDGDE